MIITISKEDGTNIILDDEKDVKGKVKPDPEKSTEVNKKEEKNVERETSKENLGLIDSIFANNLK